jgi:hypothetical protein
MMPPSTKIEEELNNKQGMLSVIEGESINL